MRRTNSGAARRLTLANPVRKASTADPGHGAAAGAASNAANALSRLNVVSVSLSQRPSPLPTGWIEDGGRQWTLSLAPAVHLAEVTRRGLDASGADVVLLYGRNARAAVVYRAVARIRGIAGSRGVIVILDQADVSMVPVLSSVGAADFIVADATRAELDARLRKGAARRPRSSAGGPVVESAPGIHLHWRTHQVSFEGTTVALTLKELQLLAVLIDHGGEVMTAADLARLAWGEVDASGGVSTTTYVCSLRKKLAWFGGRFGIQTVRGVGYRFVA